MRLTGEQCWERLRDADHGVLCTTGADGAVDAVPVCFAVVGPRLVTPIDRVKRKSTTELIRRVNLDRDPHATLLCEYWDREDWSRLWWVRARLVLTTTTSSDEPDVRSAAEDALRLKYVQYESAPFAHLFVFDVTDTTGWSAAG